MSDGLWAITSFYNPARYGRRLRNYRCFRRHLALPLVTVELGYHGAFELAREDAEILLRIPGRDVLWQKERLLNLALDALPAACDEVVWMDCDVVLGDPGWPSRVSAALERFALVRPFRSSRYTRPDWSEADLVGPDAPAEATPLPMEPFVTEDRPARDPGPRLPAKPWGKAWAARRELLAACRFYDALIVGGGDLATVFAACGAIDEACGILHLEGARARHYRAWAEGFHRAVGGRIGSLDGTVHHLWHGQLADRRYGARHAELARLGFDPEQDLELAEGGSWQWRTPKREIHDYVRDYFTSRREDG